MRSPAEISELTMLAQKRGERRELIVQVRRLTREIEEVEQALARRKTRRLGPHAAAVLVPLVENYVSESEWLASPFSVLSRRTGLSRAQVQRACKVLRRLGLARLEIGLWREDGELGGAGYRATVHGVAWSARVEA